MGARATSGVLPVLPVLHVWNGHMPACLPARPPACLPAWIASLLHLCVLCAQSHQVDAMPAHTHACRPVDASGSASSGAMPAHRSPAAKKVRLPG